MSQLPTPGLNQKAAEQFAPRQIEINPRVSTDQRFNEAGEDGILAAAADNNWISSILSRQLDRAFVKTDPNFVLTKESLLKYSEGLPDEWVDEFTDAGSDEEARVIRAQLKRRMSNSRTLQESGWPGAAANFASNIVDPVAFGAGLLTGGAGWIDKGGRLVRMGKAGLVAAAGTVPITAYQESQDPDGTVENVLYNTAGAMLLGSLGHTVGWAIKTMREIEARDVALLPPGSLTKNGVDTYGPELKQNRIADAIDAETTRAVSESDTHVEDFEGLAEAARKNELQVIDLDEAYPPRTQDVEVETAGVQKVSESDTTKSVQKQEAVPPVHMLEIDTLGGKKPAWSMTREEFSAAVPRPDKKEKITVPALAKRLESSSGDPGYAIENGIVNGSLTDRIVNVVYRSRNGTPIGILSISRNEAGIAESVRVAVMAQSRRRRIATKLYQIADAHGLGITEASGSGSLTDAGAALVHRSQVEKAIRQGLPVPENVRAQYPDSPNWVFAKKEGSELGPVRIVDNGPNFTIPRPIVPSPQGVNVPPPPAGPMGPGRQLPPPGGPLSTVVRRPRDYIAEPVDTKTWAAAVRPGRAGRLGTSEIPEMRMAGSVYTQDALARKGGEPAPYGADAWKHREFNAHMGEEEAATGPLLKKFLKDNNVPVTKRYQTALRFWEAVSFQMEGAPLGTIAPEIEAAALVHRKKYKDLLGVAKRHGVRGFENIPENADYFPHHWNVGETNAKVADWGKGAIEELVTKGIATAGNDPTWAAKASPGFLKGILNLGAFNDLDKARFFIGDADTLKSVFKRFATDLSDADAERIAEFLKPQDMGLHPRAKRRMGLDTTAFIERVKDGKTERLYLHQLLEMNAKAVLKKYTAQILGAAAESDILRAMSLRVHPDGSKAFKNFDELLAHIQGQYAKKNILTGRGKAKRDIERLVSLRNELVGIPNYDNDGFAALSRATSAFNYIRSSGTFGLAQANEFATVLNEYGAQPILQQFGFVGLVKHLLGGKVKNELLDELRLMSGVGTEGATHNVTARFRDHATIEEFSGGGKMDELLRRGERLAGRASWIIWITRIQQEIAGLGAAQKLSNIAFSKRPLSKARLADMGFSEADWNLIAPELVKNTTRDGRRVVSFNIDNWDTYAAARFISGLDRWSGRSVLGTSAGPLTKWMTHPAAKLVLQFRSFPIQAWEKLFLRGIQIHDIRAFMGWALTGVLGASTYAAQQYLASLTDKDRKKTLAKKLSWKNLAAQGFARSGASSLMPQFIDTGVGMFKVDNIFDSRYSGLNSRGLVSNPTFDAIDSGATFARGLGGLVTGHNMTKAEVRAGTRLLPFNNVLGVRNALDYFADQFPKSSK